MSGEARGGMSEQAGSGSPCMLPCASYCRGERVPRGLGRLPGGPWGSPHAKPVVCPTAGLAALGTARSLLRVMGARGAAHPCPHPRRAAAGHGCAGAVKRH